MAPSMASPMEQLEVPPGGIADFAALTDEGMAQLESEQGQAQFGSEGLGQFQEVAGRMAGYGRYGDDSVAHVQTGEIIVPIALIQNNPALREQIFQNLRDNGIEDPEKYVVGSQSNSINPETGLMEFGWLKDAWNKVKNVVKKVAKIVIPIIATATFGPIIGGAIGGGINSLIDGGNLKDAFKAGLAGAALGGIGAFAGGAMQGGLSGGWNAVKGAAQLSNLSAGWQNIKSAFTGDASGIFTTRNMAQGPMGEGGTGVVGTSTGPTNQTFTSTFSAKDAPETVTGGEVKNALDVNADQTVNLADTGPNLTADQITANDLAKDRRLVQKTGDFLFRGGDTKLQIAANQAAARTAAQNNMAAQLGQIPGVNMSGEIAQKAIFDAGKTAARQAGPSIFAKYGPTAALATAGVAAAGGFKTPPEDPPGVLDRDSTGNLVTGETLIAQNPTNYMVGDLQGGYNQNGQYTVASDYEFNSPGQRGRGDYNPFLRPLNAQIRSPYQYDQAAAMGGEIFPRRTGGVMPNEGIPNQDSVRAMLMPGEFVMTVPAVKGMGGGNMNKGIQNMYSMMRNLESRGA